MSPSPVGYVLQGKNKDPRVQLILPESPVGYLPLQPNSGPDQRLQLLLPGSDENYLVPRVIQFASNFTEKLMMNLQDERLYTHGKNPSLDSFVSGLRDSHSSNNLSGSGGTPKEDIAH